MNIVYFLLLLIAFGMILVKSMYNGYTRKQQKEGFGKLLEYNVTNTIRGISIIIIMFAHTLQQLGDRMTFNFIGGGKAHAVIFSWGGVGVALFFFLSGFGNAASLDKLSCRVEHTNVKLMVGWLAKRLIRLYIAFAICFAVVVAVLSIFGIQHMSIPKLVNEFLALRLPDCSTWYLKIQGLLYIFMTLSWGICRYYVERKGVTKRTSKVLCGGILLGLILIYFFTAVYILNLPNYWWKTSLSFWMGAIIWMNRDELDKLRPHMRENGKKEIIAWIGLIVSFSFSYIFLMGSHYSILYLPAYALLAFSMCMIMDELKLNSKVFAKIGAISLELYLIHIGCMTIMGWTVPECVSDYSVIIGVTLFIVISISLAFLINKVVSNITTKIFNKR